MIFNVNIFVIGKDNFVFEGVKAAAEKVSQENARLAFTVENISAIELLSVDNKKRHSPDRNILVVTDEYRDILTSLTPVRNFCIVPGNIKVADFIDILTSTTQTRSVTFLHKKENDSVKDINLRERQYCNLLYKGLSNEQISKIFHCPVKNIYYLKKKIMNKWNCKNSIQFYKCIHIIFGSNMIIEADFIKPATAYVSGDRVG